MPSPRHRWPAELESSNLMEPEETVRESNRPAGELDALIAKAQANLAERPGSDGAHPTAGPVGGPADGPRALAWTEWVEWVQWVEWVER